jgi:hypothetical protein
MHQPVPATERTKDAPRLRAQQLCPNIWRLCLGSVPVYDDESRIEFLPLTFFTERAATAAIVAAKFAEADLHRIVMEGKR